MSKSKRKSAKRIVGHLTEQEAAAIRQSIDDVIAGRISQKEGQRRAIKQQADGRNVLILAAMADEGELRAEEYNE